MFAAYPAVAHFGKPMTALALLAALVAYLLAAAWIHHPLRWLAPPVAGGAVYWLAPPAEWLLFVPPIAINLALAWLFGRTLLRGRVPLISRFALMEQATLSPEVAAYTRLLTWLWTALFVGAAAISLVLAMSGHHDAWSLFTNLINYLLVGALFLGEFAYRRVRFRNYRHHSPLQLLRNVRRTKLFER
ncbi:MAG TPA: hypothetical protein VFU24_05910 [Burkholderiales bacterium]|nr:hypothetical protein [Burkholderiales bacterium]